MGTLEVRAAYPSKTGGRTIPIPLRDASFQGLGRPEKFVVCAVQGNMVQNIISYTSLIAAIRDKHKRLQIRARQLFERDHIGSCDDPFCPKCGQGIKA